MQLARASAKSAIAIAIRYGLNHWDGLVRFLEDGRIEIDTNVVERSMRKNGSSPATMREPRTGPACKLNGVDPQAYLSEVLTRLVNLWPAARIDELMPAAWTGASNGGRAA